MIVKINQASFSRQKKKMDALLKALSQAAYIEGKRSAEEYSHLVRSGISVKTPPTFAPIWEPLAALTIKLKTAHKGEFWAESLGILKAVRVKIITKTTRYIHLFSGIESSTDPDAFDRAKRNEYGLHPGPARPLFEPAKDFIAPMTGGGRRLRNKNRFISAARKAIRKVYR